MSPTPTGPERAELEELARLLPPVPDGTGLPPGRHSHHKDVLMQFIDREQGRAEGSESPAQATGTDTGTGRAPRRFTRPALLAGAVATAVAAALTAGLLTGNTGATGSHGGGAASGSRSEAGGTAGAAVMLDRIAEVAMKTDVEPVKESQFVYVKSKGATNAGKFGGRIKLGAVHERQVWFPQRKGVLIHTGLIREYGQDWPIEVGVPDGTDPKDAGYPEGIDRPTYAWLASLPTDPKALLRLLYEQTRVGKGIEDRDQAVFDQIGELIREQIMPPATAAAFFKAAALIPKVSVLPDAVDAAGRHGIAITRTDTQFGERTEWIFDRHTLSYLGERVCLSRDTERGKAGTVTSTWAVLERAVVDEEGQEPSSGNSKGSGKDKGTSTSTSTSTS